MQYNQNSLTKQDIFLSPRELCDFELITNQGFAPLTTFMGQETYNSVLQNMQLPNGTPWPIPIVLSIDQKTADSLHEGDKICLRNTEFYPLATLTVNEIWAPDKTAEAFKIYGTDDPTHPGVSYLLNHTKSHYISGPLKAIHPIYHHDFTTLRQTPTQLKQHFKQIDQPAIVGFQTRNPMHRAHVELTRRAADTLNAHLLIHPVVGVTKPGDIDYLTRVKCYQKLLERYPKGLATLSLLPLAMRMAGPREALWHAIIRKNYGCTHFIVGRDHAGPGKDKNGKPFYDPYEAQALVKQYEDKIGIQMVPFQEVVYVENKKAYFPINQVDKNDQIMRISGTEFREKLRQNAEIPAWFSYPEVIAELKKAHPPKHQQGLTIFFTGLSGAGKSTLANALSLKLMELDDRPVTLLDGDIVRQHLSQELGFSKAHRDMNVLRIAYVASLITKSRGIALCAPIAPYADIRQQCRELIRPYGQFIEVHVSTPLETCEIRDTKGLYAKARAGLIKQFTGIDDPYEAPKNPELSLDTTQIGIQDSVTQLLNYLTQNHYIQTDKTIKPVNQVVEMT